MVTSRQKWLKLKIFNESLFRLVASHPIETVRISQKHSCLVCVLCTKLADCSTTVGWGLRGMERTLFSTVCVEVFICFSECVLQCVGFTSCSGTQGYCSFLDNSKPTLYNTCVEYRYPCYFWATVLHKNDRLIYRMWKSNFVLTNHF